MNDAKRELVRDWLQKASDDLRAARLLAGADPPLGEVAAYHCQQAAEKSLKGFLVHSGERPERTHDVRLLVERAAAIEPGFNNWLDQADRLTPLATAYRYPGPLGFVGPEDVDEALGDARTILDQVLAYVPRNVHPTSTDLT